MFTNEELRKAISREFKKISSAKVSDPGCIPSTSPIQIPEPAGFYVYAYIDAKTLEPFYIGKGYRNRLTRHLTRRSLRNKDTFFYRKLRKIFAEGNLPVVEVIKDGLTEEEAFASEIALIQLVGTRAHGTGPLCNIKLDRRGIPAGYTLAQGQKKGTAVQVWGEWFPSLTHVTKDSRCEVLPNALRYRLKNGIPIEEAVKRKRKKRMNRKPITCWNQEFESQKALSEDSRCVVSFSTLRNRLRYGWPPEKAATISRETKPRKYRRSFVCWNQKFPTLRAISNDPRCKVTYRQLVGRRNAGWPLDKAANTPINEFYSKQGRLRH